MKEKIRIVPSKSNRYEERQFNNVPINKAKFKSFMIKIDKLILHLNKLISINEDLFVMTYKELCMIINNDLIDFNSKPQKVNELIEEIKVSYMNIYDSYESKYNNKPVKGFEELNHIFSILIHIIDLMKHLNNANKSCVGKLRGIIMEAICISIFGNITELKENDFVWDFNAYEDDELIVISKRQTADIYFKEAMTCLISEVKCRPSGIDEGQVDFINYVVERIDTNNRYTPKKIILHGGTIDDFNYLKIGFREKLDGYKVYCSNSIEQLLRELPI